MTSGADFFREISAVTALLRLGIVTVVVFIHVFRQDDEGKTGPFLDEYRTQYRGDRHAYVEDIRKQLGTTSYVESYTMLRVLRPQINLLSQDRVTF